MVDFLVALSCYCYLEILKSKVVHLYHYSSSLLRNSVVIVGLCFSSSKCSYSRLINCKYGKMERLVWGFN